MLSVQEEIEKLAGVLCNSSGFTRSHGGKKSRLSRKGEETKYTESLRHFSSIPLYGKKMLFSWFQKMSTHTLSVLSGRCQDFCGIYTAKYLIFICGQL